MKIIILFLAAFCSAMSGQKAQAQALADPQINISAVTDSFNAGGMGTVLVQICNTTGGDIAAGKLRPLISAGEPYVEILSATSTDGSTLSGYKIQSLGNGAIRLLYEKVLTGNACVSFHVNAKLKDAQKGKSEIFSATLGFQGPPVNGNNTGNDNSTTTILVGK